MEKTITFLGVESIQYVFTEGEVAEALMEKYQIKHSYDCEFAFYEPFDEKPARAVLVIRYTKPVEEKI